MKTISSIDEMQQWSRNAKGRGLSIGFVPTMGALHEGHLSLIRAARKENDRVVVSVFVNPLQFGDPEDLNRYPRDPEGDAEKAETSGTDLFFDVSAGDLYPEGFSTFVVPEGLSSRWEGESRPGHFRGVATIVCKLFHLVSPDRAYFGRKDAQQLAMIRRMCRDLNLDVTIVPCKTKREADGLAMSSRNALLSPEERDQALAISKALRAADRLYREGERRRMLLTEVVSKTIAAVPSVHLDYAAFVDPETFDEVGDETEAVQALIAARVGKIRLIDNHILGTEW